MYSRLGLRIEQKIMDCGVRNTVVCARDAETCDLFLKHPSAALPARTGVPMIAPTCMGLRESVGDGTAASLGVRKDS